MIDWHTSLQVRRIAGGMPRTTPEIGAVVFAAEAKQGG